MLTWTPAEMTHCLWEIGKSAALECLQLLDSQLLSSKMSAECFVVLRCQRALLLSTVIRISPHACRGVNKFVCCTLSRLCEVKSAADELTAVSYEPLYVFHCEYKTAGG